MEEEISPVKEYLFEYLEKEKIQTKLSMENSTKLTRKIISNCAPKIAEFEGSSDENLAILATGVMHYMLTNLLIPSQRKIMVNNVKIDIVVPDRRTLSSKPQDTIVICISKTLDSQHIQKRLSEIQKIQPERKNIWVILPKDLNIIEKTFVITQESFANIFKELNEFVSSKKFTQFKIFKN